MTREETCRRPEFARSDSHAAKVVAVAEVDVEEVPAGPQHPLDLAEEAVEVRVDVRGLDVDHRVEGFVRERQVLGVTVHEVQARHLVPLLAEFDSGRVEVQTGVGGRLQRAGQVRGAAAMAGAALQHLLAGEVDAVLGRGLVVELDAVPVRLVGRVERQTQWRVLLVAPVQELNIVLLVQPLGHQGVPVPEELFVRRRRTDAVDETCADVVQ